ncbi:hypothetical protein NHH03_00205 [Stieleria sp. TO1_6]|nr:hypothetical protein [Stieleria tagensis]
MGTKASVREKFLSACELILDAPIPRQGPTEVSVDDSFRYETLFIGNKHVTESLTLSINILDGDPHSDKSHPVWAFIRRIVEHTGWQAEDTHNGAALT